MKTSEKTVETRPTGVCRSEGCGRPAEGPVCETCALEWDLYHREARQAGLSAASGRRR